VRPAPAAIEREDLDDRPLDTRARARTPKKRSASRGAGARA
jgi:hypothetical protein